MVQENRFYLELKTERDPLLVLWDLGFQETAWILGQTVGSWSFNTLDDTVEYFTGEKWITV